MLLIKNSSKQGTAFSKTRFQAPATLFAVNVSVLPAGISLPWVPYAAAVPFKSSLTGCHFAEPSGKNRTSFQSAIPVAVIAVTSWSATDVALLAVPAATHHSTGSHHAICIVASHKSVKYNLNRQT